MAEDTGAGAAPRARKAVRKADPRMDVVDAALAADTHAGAVAALHGLGPERVPLPPAARMRLQNKLRGFPDALRPLRLALLRSFATEPLRQDLSFEALVGGFALELHEAPYGVFHQAAAADGELARFAPDVTCLLVRLEDLAPAWRDGAFFASEAAAQAAIEQARDLLSGIVREVRAGVQGLVVLSILPGQEPPRLGFADATHAVPEELVRQRLLAALARALDDIADVALDDASELVRAWGRRRLFDARLWHSSRFPFSADGAQLVAQRLFAFVGRFLVPPVKCVVLDADNTLWGGIVGEDGPEGIALGPQYPGSAFVAWQKRLLAFRERGLLLALCSKNDEASVAEVLDSHPHQVLKREHFSAQRVNWEPKPDNLRALAAELNLGLDAFLFVDDSPHECHAVRSTLPDVAVVQAPANPLALVTCLDAEPRLEVFRRTDEDRRRADMYAQEAARRTVAASAASPEDYLRSLGMVLRFFEDAPAHVPRVAQLTQKTNQFNLTTRRYTEAEIEAALAASDARVWAFALRDAFGDSGLVGVAVGRFPEPHVIELEAFLMSCRVIGRKAEEAFLTRLLLQAAEAGASAARAAYLPTPKNGLVADFWTRNGFAETGEGRYERSLADPSSLRMALEALPIVIEEAEPTP